MLVIGFILIWLISGLIITFLLLKPASPLESEEETLLAQKSYTTEWLPNNIACRILESWIDKIKWNFIIQQVLTFYISSPEKYLAKVLRLTRAKWLAFWNGHNNCCLNRSRLNKKTNIKGIYFIEDEIGWTILSWVSCIQALQCTLSDTFWVFKTDWFWFEIDYTTNIW